MTNTAQTGLGRALRRMVTLTATVFFFGVAAFAV